MKISLPGARATSRAFWSSLGVSVVLLVIIDALGRASRPGGPDSYAMGAGALLPYAIVVLIVVVALLFAFVRWRPLRLLLAGAGCCAAAFLLMATTWFL